MELHHPAIGLNLYNLFLDRYLSEPYLLTIRLEGRTDTTIEHHCTASIGVTLFLDHVASRDDLLKRADAEMYQAKQAGRNLIRFHEEKDGVD